MTALPVLAKLLKPIFNVGLNGKSLKLRSGASPFLHERPR
jgi:hypothetical protein